MRYKFYKSIIFQLLITTVLTVTFVTLVVLYIEKEHADKHYIKSIDDNLLQIETSFKNTIADALWTYNEEELQTIVNTLIQIPYVQYVAIESTNGALKYTKGIKLRSNSKSSSLRLYKNHLGENRDVGFFYVEPKYDYSRSFFASLTIDDIHLIIFQTLFTVILFLLLTYFLIIRPILQIAKYTKSIDVHNIDNFNILENMNNKFLTNEIQQLNKTINSLIRKIKDELSKLKESEAKYRHLFSSIRDVVIIADKDRVITDANQPSLRNQFGYELNEVIGKKTSILYAEDKDFSDVGEEVFDIDTPKGDLFNIYYKKKNGEIFPSELLANKLIDDDGNIVGNFGLIRDISERKATNEKLLASLKEKETLIQEVHHRVKNNMQVIYSLLAYHTDTFEKTELADVYLSIQNRILSMATVHQMLYSSSNLQSIMIKEYVEKLIEIICNSYGNNKIKYSVIGNNVSLGIEKAVPVGLIFNEIISNSLKYANKSNELFINVKMFLENEELHFYISDNGVGFPEGFDIEKSESLGMTLIAGLVEQLYGSLTFGNDNGVYYKIRIPYKDD